jgi:hypothetical protein
MELRYKRLVEKSSIQLRRSRGVDWHTYCVFPPKWRTAEKLQIHSPTSKPFNRECWRVYSVSVVEMGKIADYGIFSTGLGICIIFSASAMSVHFSLNPSLVKCGDSCGMVIQITEIIWLTSLIILFGLILVVVGFQRIRNRRMDTRAGIFSARRVSGTLGEVGDLDFHIPPTDDAPANLFGENSAGPGRSASGQAGAGAGKGANSEFKNPFEF